MKELNDAQLAAVANDTLSILVLLDAEGSQKRAALVDTDTLDRSFQIQGEDLADFRTDSGTVEVRNEFFFETVVFFGGRAILLGSEYIQSDEAGNSQGGYVGEPVSGYDSAIEQATGAVAHFTGNPLPFSDDTRRALKAIIGSLWNYTREKADDGELDVATYGFFSSTLFMAVPGSEQGIDAHACVALSARLRSIRLEYFAWAKQDRIRRMEELRNRSQLTAS